MQSIGSCGRAALIISELLASPCDNSIHALQHTATTPGHTALPRAVQHAALLLVAEHLPLNQVHACAPHGRPIEAELRQLLDDSLLWDVAADWYAAQDLLLRGVQLRLLHAQTSCQELAADGAAAQDLLLRGVQLRFLHRSTKVFAPTDKAKQHMEELKRTEQLLS
jgi:plasmid stability protein